MVASHWYPDIKILEMGGGAFHTTRVLVLPGLACLPARGSGLPSGISAHHNDFSLKWYHHVTDIGGDTLLFRANSTVPPPNNSSLMTSLLGNVSTSGQHFWGTSSLTGSTMKLQFGDSFPLWGSGIPKKFLNFCFHLFHLFFHLHCLYQQRSLKL